MLMQDLVEACHKYVFIPLLLSNFYFISFSVLEKAALIISEDSDFLNLLLLTDAG